jgi:hypothetical protein
LPHWAQNLAPACKVVLHCEHAAGANEEPHCWQNRAPGALMVRQLGHDTPLMTGGGGLP